MSDLQMKVGFVVLYVNDVEACVRFWVDKVGMVERARTQAGAFHVVKVGFENQDFSFDLVPLALMRENPDGLDLATPSAAFHVPNLEAARAALVARGVQATEISSERGPRAFASPIQRAAGSPFLAEP